jgi:protein TonB
LLEVFSARPHVFDHGDELLLENVAALVADITTAPAETALSASPEPVRPAAVVSPLTILPAEQEIEPTQQLQPSATVPSQPPATTIAPVATVESPAAMSAGKERPEALIPVEVGSISSFEPGEQPSASGVKQIAALSSAALGRLFPVKTLIWGTALLATVLFVAGWRHRRIDPPSKSAPAATPVTEIQSRPPSAQSAPAVLLAANTTRDRVTSVEVTSPKPETRARVITLPPPKFSGSEAPQLAALLGSPGGESAISGVLSAPVVAPKLDLPRVSRMTGGKLIKKVDPIYPSSAVPAVNSEVVLKAIIDRKGQVTKVRVVRGQAVLAQAAVAAVSLWRYEPFLLNGVPIDVESDIVFRFKQSGK